MSGLVTLAQDRESALRVHVESLNARYEELENDRDHLASALASLRIEHDRTKARLRVAQDDNKRARLAHARQTKESRALMKTKMPGDPIVPVVPQRPTVGPLRLAVNKTQAAEALGVSVDYFDRHIAVDLRCVRRGRRRLYPVAELHRWLDAEAENVSAAWGPRSL